MVLILQIAAGVILGSIATALIRSLVDTIGQVFFNRDPS